VKKGPALKEPVRKAEGIPVPSIIPKTLSGQVEFFGSRLAAWQADPGAIGLTAAQVDALAQQVADAKAALLAAHQARDAAEAATLLMRGAVGRLRSGGGALLNTIRAFAQTSGGGNAVYVAALVPPPKQPSLAPPVEAPESLRASIGTDGSVTLSWVARQPVPGAAVFCEVSRAIDTGSGPSTFVLLGGSGDGAFRDGSIPPGTRGATYRVRAMRAGGRRAQPHPPEASVTIALCGSPESRYALAA
jgi:hypothetical protein